MEIRRFLAGACAIAGIALLAGLGWALLSAAALLFVSSPPQRIQAVSDRVRVSALALWRWLTTGRQAIAAASMPLAILSIGIGLGLAVGAGWGIAAAGVVVGGLSIAADKAG